MCAGFLKQDFDLGGEGGIPKFGVDVEGVNST